jgi:hypothetical protein
MTYHRVCNKNNTTDPTWGVGTAYPSGAHEFALGFYIILIKLDQLMLGISYSMVVHLSK